MVSSSDATAGPLHLQLPRRKEGRKHVEVKERRVTPVVPHAEHARAWNGRERNGVGSAGQTDDGQRQKHRPAFFGLLQIEP